jgi:hypothetical protein
MNHLNLQGFHISHLIIPCCGIADHIQHLICLWSTFYHENDVLIMQISFSDVIKSGRLCSTEFSKSIDKTDHNVLTAGNVLLKYSVLTVITLQIFLCAIKSRLF